MKHSSYEAFIPKPSSVQQYNTEKNFFQDGFTKKGLKRALGENGKRKGGKGVRPTAFPFVSHLTPFFRPFCPMPPVESAGFSAAARLPSLAFRLFCPACCPFPLFFGLSAASLQRFGRSRPSFPFTLPFSVYTGARLFGFSCANSLHFSFSPSFFPVFTDCFQEGFIKQSQFNIFFNTCFFICFRLF